MKTRKVVNRIMALYSTEYQGRFSVTPERIDLWVGMLTDYPPDAILTAAMQLLATHKTWPPGIADLREMCANIVHGELSIIGAGEAWGRVREWLNDEPIQLTYIEKKALKSVGDSWYLRRSENTVADRAAFTRAYEDIAKKIRLDRVSLPDVKQLIDEQTAQMYLPEKTIPAREDDTAKIATKEEVDEMVAKLAKNWSA